MISNGLFFAELQAVGCPKELLLCGVKQFITFLLLTYLLQYIFNMLATTFLGAFAELRKANISFIMSVRTEQVDSHWTDFH
jgi:hypothetical protein